MSIAAMATTSAKRDNSGNSHGRLGQINETVHGHQDAEGDREPGQRRWVSAFFDTVMQHGLLRRKSGSAG